MRVLLGDRPLVLFRTGGRVGSMLDVCPHRSAPLSQGRIVKSGIECPYHGWRFGIDGKCAAVPGLVGAIPRVSIPTYAATEQDGLIFVSPNRPKGRPYTRGLAGPDVISTTLQSSVRSTLAEVAENILDATHTHFTHKGLLRGLSSARYRVTVSITGGDDWVEARYVGEPRQDGIVSRLFEGERSVSVGRFRMPGIAELEFWGRSRINLATTFHLRETTPGNIHGLAMLSGYRQGGLGFLKSWMLKPFFLAALGQDRRILERSTDNRSISPARKQMIGPLDIMRPHIEAILSGHRPEVADNPREIIMEL